MPGLKYSRQRESIINCLKRAEGPPDSRYDLRVGAGRVSRRSVLGRFTETFLY